MSWYGNTWGQRYFERHGKQTTNLASVSLRTLRSLPVPVAPLDVQAALAAQISERLEEITRIQAATDALCKRAMVLRGTLLSAAIEGRLVPQDPSDEPAELLLKRLEAERQAQAAIPKPARTVRKRAATAAKKTEESA